MRYRRQNRRQNPDRRQVDLGPPAGVERRRDERRQLADRRASNGSNLGTQTSSIVNGQTQSKLVAALVGFCHRVDALEARIGLTRRTPL